MTAPVAYERIKTPVMVMCYDGTEEVALAVCKWLNDHRYPWLPNVTGLPKDPDVDQTGRGIYIALDTGDLVIRTLKMGDIVVNIGDYIIYGNNRDFYVRNKYEFHDKYRKA